VVALEIWYNQTPANDYNEGESAIVVETVAELDALVDRVLSESKDATVPPMIEVSVKGDFKAPVLEVGLGQEEGFIHCLSKDGGWSVGDSALTGTVTYDYMGQVREVPESNEVPVAVVRNGLREFMATKAAPELCRH
jgi:hypothetical protein